MVDARAQAANVARNLRYRPVGAVREFASLLRYSVQSTTDPDPVLDADWDVLVVLDACRADLFADVAADADYDFLPDDVAGSRTSPASSSEEWLAAVFGRAEDAALADLAYVTGNPFSASDIDASRLHSVEEVWRSAWDDDVGTIPPRPVTDAAVRTWRTTDADRMVVHYMQPHFPSVPAAEDGVADDGISLSRFGETSLSVWDDVRFGRRSETETWRAYRRNLEYVLEDLDILFSNLDAHRAVVTADHGNAFGERGVYGHPGGVDLPCLRTVPWCAVDAVDDHTYEPDRRTTSEQDADSNAERGDEDSVIEDRLADLGYRT